MKKKITTTVEVLTHVKEKLQFVQAENQVTKGRLREVEEEVAKVNIYISFGKLPLLNAINVCARTIRE